MPMLLPMLRIRLKMAVPWVRTERAGSKTDRAQRHKNKAQPETLNQPGDDNRLVSMASENPLI